MTIALIADDDPNVLSTYAEALGAAGFETVTCANGQDAVERFAELQARGDKPRVVVLDLLLPKMSGHDAAAAIRQLSADVPIVFVTGVFKSGDHKRDAQAKYGVRAYFEKPVSIDRLTEACRDAAGLAKFAGELKARQQAAGATALPRFAKHPLPVEGGLLENPVLHLLWRIATEGHSGILEVFGSRCRGRVFAYRGQAVMAQCSVPDVNVGVELVRRGNLTAAQYAKAAELAVQRRQGIHAVIKTEGFTDDPSIKQAYRSLMPRALAPLLAATGTFRWNEGEAFARLIPAAPIDLFEVVKAGLRETPAADLKEHVEPRAPIYLSPGANWQVIAGLTEEACGAANLLPHVTGQYSVGQMLNAAQGNTDLHGRLRQAFLLMSTQAVGAAMQPSGTPITAPVPEAAHAAPQPAAPRPAAPQPAAAPRPAAPAPQPAPAPRPAAPAPQPAAAPRPAAPRPPADTQRTASAPSISATPRLAAASSAADAGIAFTPEEQEARVRIRAKLAELDGKDHYQVLGVAPDADAGTIKKAYFALARDFHTDSFGALRLGAAAADLDTVFARIQDANATLSDPNKRAEFDAGRQMVAAGMSTDIAALFEAENQFVKGQTLIDRGQTLGAIPFIEEALRINPTNTEWKGYLTYARWWKDRDAIQATMAISQLEQAYKELPACHNLGYFAGHIALETGDLRRARNSFRRVLTEDPNHAGANRLNRMITKKVEEAEKKGGGLLGRFRKS